MRAVIDVDDSGRDAEGQDYGWAATPEVVAEGLMVNKPVTLRFPGGMLIESVQALVTPKGLERLRREFPVGMRDPSGSA